MDINTYSKHMVDRCTESNCVGLYAIMIPDQLVDINKMMDKDGVQTLEEWIKNKKDVELVYISEGYNGNHGLFWLWQNLFESCSGATQSSIRKNHCDRVNIDEKGFLFIPDDYIPDFVSLDHNATVRAPGFRRSWINPLDNYDRESMKNPRFAPFLGTLK